MKHLQPYTEFINESESLPREEGVIETNWDDFFNAKRNRSVPLSPEDIAKLESLSEMTGGVNRHGHMKNKSNKETEYIVCKDQTSHSYIPPIATFGKVEDGAYNLHLKMVGNINFDQYYIAPTLEPLIGITLEAFLDSGQFKSWLNWTEIK